MRIYNQDNREALKELPDNSVDSVVTDPPYGLSFMNKKWDYDVPSVEFWKEIYRVLKPGGHILSFGGTRTYHRMVVNIEDAGFEIRDQIQWIYGSGFPKSLNIGKAVDKIEGNEREAIEKNPYVDGGIRRQTGQVSHYECYGKYNLIPLKNGLKNDTKGTSPFEGWGSALKPANEPIVLARKPLSEKSIAENVMRWGTGGLNIDGCRIGTDDKLQKLVHQEGSNMVVFDRTRQEKGKKIEFVDAGQGRFPANVILECCCDEVIQGEKGEVKKTTRNRSSMKENGYGFGENIEGVDCYGDKGDIHTNPDCPCYIMDEQSGFLKGDSPNRKPRVGGHREVYVGTENNNIKKPIIQDKVFDSGGASRFFYRAKVSKKERNLGLDGFDENEVIRQGLAGEKNNPIHKNNHPTVKPINLLTYLCRLITPERGIILDPFMGSGSTGVAALLEGFDFIGIELEKDYYNIAKRRIEKYEEYKKIIK